MKNELMAVAPVRPAAPYIGGKRNLSSRLVERIGSIAHDLYAEPFVGMGGIFFRRRSKPTKEVVNDISKDVVNLFRILQRHYQAFLDMLKWQICSRAEFQRLSGLDPTRLTDLERAARFLYIQRTAFGGKVHRPSYGMSRTNPARFDITKLIPMLEDIHERLSSVDIECLPYQEFIPQYDTPRTLFYLDPPYFGCEDDYGPGVFSTADFDLLRGVLKGIKGRFILSINDHPTIREIFAAFSIEEVELTYRLSGKATPARELVISN